MKKFALYLPQFHEIPENDLWWGKGFTEWTNVKKAKPLFKNHMQPKVPLNNNYYYLDDIESIKWQCELANKYKIDGFVFYHYYFCGKKLLEKPAELLLKNRDINIKYFFCWANHTWRKTWEGSTEILLEQKYGKNAEWEDHFKYLLPFFKDERYEKKDNKPIFMVFKIDFSERKDMFEYFNMRCKQEGFDGIFIIETVTNYNKRKIDGLLKENVNYEKNVYIREPDAALVEFKKSFKYLMFKVFEKIRRCMKTPNSSPVQRVSGNWLYSIMNKKKNRNEKIIRGVFFSWDNTARHGNRGYVINEVSKSNFLKYMNKRKEDEMLIINAWNEWCEGMILEPTENEKFKYLEWIKE